MSRAAEPTHVTHVLRKLTADAWGGTETHVAAISRALLSERVQSTIHAPGQGPRPAAIDPRVPVARFSAFCPFVASAERRRRLWETGGNIVSIEEPLRLALERRTALAHLHTMGRLGGAVRTAMRLTGRPYVVSVHGPLAAESEFLAAHTKERLDGTLDLGAPFGLLFGARRVLDDAARVIVFNEGERRALEGRLGARVVRMDHGVDLERHAAGDASRALARWPELAGRRIVLVVGRISKQKNQLFAVRAFAKGAPPDAVLVLAGAETDPGYAAEVLAEAAALGVAERVRWLGNVAPAVVPDLVAAAELMMVPSVHEAFGLVVIEGWAANRPVLFSRLAGLLDIAENLEDDRVALPVSDVEAWSTALRDLMSDPDRRARLADEGAAVVRRRYTWPRVAESLASLYRAVIEENQARLRGKKSAA